jgi:hypothetical protein
MPRLVVHTVALAAFAAFSAVPVARAQQAPPMELTRLSAPVTIDGTPNEPAWQAIPALPLTMYMPVFRGTPTQRTELRVAYDDEAFYAAGWFYDADPKGIRVNSLYRDRWNGDDALAIYIDPFNDNQNAKWFGTTAGGMRFDVLLSDDGGTSNNSWDTFWDAKSTITDQGWFVETRIPFSSIGFRPDSAGNVTMGLTVTRLVSRLSERVTFPAIDPKFEFRRPSVAQDVVLRGVQQHTPLYVTPYVLGGTAATAAATPSALGAYPTTDATRREVGLDIRYPLSGNLTLDVTANTDFAQVEADDQQVNLDRFPLFFPERRRFFQEGSGIFDFTAGGGTRLFHSRRIGLAADGSPVPIYGGARLVGRAAGWDVGALEMQTRAHNDAPSENFGVLRLRHGILDDFSTAGLMVTSFADGDRTNLGLGGDAVIRAPADHFLTLRLSSTVDSRDSSGVSLAERSLAHVVWERRTQRGLQYNFTATRMGADYRPEIGFLQRTDFTQANLYGNWFIYTDKHPWLRRYYPGWLAFQTYRNADHALESAQYAVWVQWDTKAGGGGWIEPKWFHENVLRPFSIGSTTVPAGVYDFADLQVALSMAQGRKLRTSLDFRTGTFYDGTRTQAILTPTWNVSRNLELGADYQVSDIRFASRDQHETIQVARLRVRTALDVRASGNAFVQYNSTTDRVDVNVRLRYAFAEGTDLWFVYNEGLDTDRTTNPQGYESPFSLARTFVVKLTRTFIF